MGVIGNQLGCSLDSVTQGAIIKEMCGVQQ